MALGGWDTHIGEGAASGQLAGHLQPLGEGLASLAKSLGPSYQDTVIVVISDPPYTAQSLEGIVARST